MTLAERVDAALSRTVDPAVTAFAARLAGEADTLAVLFYGSNLRTGSLEGVIDFYVLTDGAAEKGLWPRVSYREWDHDGQRLRAKIATMTLAKFAQAARGDSLDTTIWARFVQPSALVWTRDDDARRQMRAAITDAAVTAARLAIAVGPASGAEWDYWRALFQATYRAELRVEKPGRENSILELNEAHFTGLLPCALDAAGIDYAREKDGLSPTMPDDERRAVLKWWRTRRRLGKALNIARLVRATRTFDGAGRYAAWKVQRHTGVEVEVTPWREKHPILSAPGVLFRVWRAKRRS
ncbi:hypothetical protein [Aurantiacibacter gangjinensis]|uniref:Uncharacterized protein n=1 Tax=Aurantiacibacter gangjinensis TaxID=502682 RepID=A0A0G9MLA4_9SPHN|nr:hypothetical protein [Aurantiacibacter gangjinensis]APE27395.1 hypothetical protein BMF35_a0566 [Aurantiacibacter gangjinensis]KLE31475.1 hypothetical protein AAW01_07805 [Aurantiacibacter gangjinensis]